MVTSIKTYAFLTVLLLTTPVFAVPFPAKPVPLGLIDLNLDFDFSEDAGDPINTVDLHCPDWPQGIDCINRQQLMSFYNVDVFDNDPHTFSNLPILTIISHESSGFDLNELTFPAARRLLSFSIQAGVPRMGLISTQPEFGIGTQVFQQKHVNYVVESKGGQHNMQFPQTGTFLIAGGNLSFCLCDFLRDTIHGTVAYTKPVNFIFLTDGVYDDSTFWPSELPSPLTPTDQDSLDDGEQVQFVLTSLLAAGSNDVFLNYLAKNVLGLGTEFCPGQNFSGHEPIDSSQHTFHISLSQNGQVKELKTFGTSGRQFNFIFTPSQDLISTLNQTGTFSP